MPRCHVLDGRTEGALLLELYTCDGVGTMVSRDLYEGMRQARPDDANRVARLLKPLEDDGTLMRREYSQLVCVFASRPAPCPSMPAPTEHAPFTPGSFAARSCLPPAGVPFSPCLPLVEHGPSGACRFDPVPPGPRSCHCRRSIPCWVQPAGACFLRPSPEAAAASRQVRDINDFTIVERDGKCVATAALIPYADRINACAEVAAFAVHSRYRGAGAHQLALPSSCLRLRQQPIPTAAMVPGPAADAAAGAADSSSG